MTQGALVVTLPVSGAMESASETPVRCQLDGTLVDIAPDNTPVKPGDFAFQLDTKDLVNQRDDLAGALADAQEALSTTEATVETNLAQAEARCRDRAAGAGAHPGECRGERGKGGGAVGFRAGADAKNRNASWSARNGWPS